VWIIAQSWPQVRVAETTVAASSYQTDGTQRNAPDTTVASTPISTASA
jgi:hypothetical protein